MLMQELTANEILKKFYQSKKSNIEELIISCNIEISELDENKIENELKSLWFNPFVHIKASYKFDIVLFALIPLGFLPSIILSVILMVNNFNFKSVLIFIVVFTSFISISFAYYNKLKELYKDFICRKEEILKLVKPIEMTSSPIV